MLATVIQLRAPQHSSIQPIDLMSPLFRLVCQMASSARAVPALTVPQTNENELFLAETSGKVQHPKIIALVRMPLCLLGAELIGHNVHLRAGFGFHEASMPSGVGEVDGLCKEGRLI